jgi:hypothetical protein
MISFQPVGSDSSALGVWALQTMPADNITIGRSRIGFFAVKLYLQYEQFQACISHTTGRPYGAGVQFSFFSHILRTDTLVIASISMPNNPD